MGHKKQVHSRDGITIPFHQTKYKPYAAFRNVTRRQRWSLKQLYFVCKKKQAKLKGLCSEWKTQTWWCCPLFCIPCGVKEFRLKPYTPSAFTKTERASLKVLRWRSKSTLFVLLVAKDRSCFMLPLLVRRVLLDGSSFFSFDVFIIQNKWSKITPRSFPRR